MLAALIASQSLVAFVAAAPTPAVTSLDTLYKDYPDKVERIKCFIAKDPKKVCRPKDHSEIDFAVDFLAEHGLCKAINPTVEIDFQMYGLDVRNLPMVAYCYFKARECGKLTKANFPKYKTLDSVNARTIDSVNSLCYGLNLKKNCQNAIDTKQCNKFHAMAIEEKYNYDRSWCLQYPNAGLDCHRFYPNWDHERA
jgi:hypothetical protein